MHPAVTAEKPAQPVANAAGWSSRPRVVSYRPPGQVLAVPQSAVVDTGARKVVFVESMPGMFDGVEVVLGPRCGDFYPVVRGLEAGQKVATAGAFLLDAETRLNPEPRRRLFRRGRGERGDRARPRQNRGRPQTIAAAAASRALPRGPPVAEAPESSAP